MRRLHAGLLSEDLDDVCLLSGDLATAGLALDLGCRRTTGELVLATEEAFDMVAGRRVSGSVATGAAEAARCLLIIACHNVSGTAGGLGVEEVGVEIARAADLLLAEVVLVCSDWTPLLSASRPEMNLPLTKGMPCAASCSFCLGRTGL